MSFDLSFLDNDVTLIVLAFIVALYASSLRVELPEYIVKLFQNDIFRVVYLSLLLIISFKRPPHVAIALALIFVVTLYLLNLQESFANLKQLETFRSQLLYESAEIDVYNTYSTNKGQQSKNQQNKNQQNKIKKNKNQTGQYEKRIK